MSACQGVRPASHSTASLSCASTPRTSPRGKHKPSIAEVAQEAQQRSSAGFTLIEVLIALLIAAMTVAALARTTTGAVRSSRVAMRYDEAVARAQSHLAALSASPLVDSDRQGDEGGGFHWRVRIAAAGVAHPARQFETIPAGAFTLYRVTVTMSWTEAGRVRAVQLDSARLGPVA